MTPPLTQYAMTALSRLVAFLKRAQIFAADVWQRFGGRGFGKFHDIDALTTFADYRCVQLHVTTTMFRAAARDKRHSTGPIFYMFNL